MHLKDYSSWWLVQDFSFQLPVLLWKSFKRREKKKKKIGSGGPCNYCTLKAPMYQSYCRWLLCLSQQLFQGLGAQSKTTTPPNSCPLSEMKMFVGPAWQEAGGRLAPGTAARPRTGSHAFGTGGCSLQAWWARLTREGLPRLEAHKTCWEEPQRHWEALRQAVLVPRALLLALNCRDAKTF